MAAMARVNNGSGEDGGNVDGVGAVEIEIEYKASQPRGDSTHWNGLCIALTISMTRRRTGVVASGSLRNYF